METFIAILLVIAAIIGGFFIGLTDWFDALMKIVGGAMLDKTE